MYVKTNGYRKIYPKTSNENSTPHVTIEHDDLQTVGDPVIGDCEFSKFHVTQFGQGNKKVRISFQEKDATWSHPFVVPNLRPFLPGAKDLAKEFLTRLDADVQCSW